MMQVLHGTERNPTGETKGMWGNRPPRCTYRLHTHTYFTYITYTLHINVVHMYCTHITHVLQHSQHTHCTHIAYKHYMHSLHVHCSHTIYTLHTHWPIQFLCVESDKFIQSSTWAFVPAKYHYHSVSEIP